MLKYCIGPMCRPIAIMDSSDPDVPAGGKKFKWIGRIMCWTMEALLGDVYRWLFVSLCGLVLIIYFNILVRVYRFLYVSVRAHRQAFQKLMEDKLHCKARWEVLWYCSQLDGVH